MLPVRIAIYAVAALAPIGAMAQETEPSSKAMELAKLLGPSNLFQRPTMPREFELKQTLNSIYSTTLAWKGEPCDEKDSLCAAVAHEIAGRMLEDRAKHQRRLAEYVYAVHFEQTLSGEDIDNAISFLKTKPGQKLSASISSVWDDSRTKQLFNPNSDLSKKILTWKTTPYLEEFYDRTVGLPRTKRMAPPPPPGPRIFKRPEGQ